MARSPTAVQLFDASIGGDTVLAAVTDDFERATLGSNWAVPVGTAALTDGALGSATVGNGFLIAEWIGSAVPEDCECEATVDPAIVYGNPGASGLQVFVRYQGEGVAGPRYGFHFNPLTGEYELKFDGAGGGAEVTVASAPGSQFPGGTVVTIRAVTLGPTTVELRGYLNGQEILVGTHEGVDVLGAGSAGLVIAHTTVQGGAGPVTHGWKDFTVRAAPAPSGVIAVAARGVGSSRVLASGGAPGGEVVADFQDSFLSGDLTKQVDLGGGDIIRWAGGIASATSPLLKRTGTHGLRFEYVATAPCGQNNAERRFYLGAATTIWPEIALEWYVWYPDGTEGIGSAELVLRACNPSNRKFLRLWTGNPGDGNDGYSQYYNKGGWSLRRRGDGQIEHILEANTGGIAGVGPNFSGTKQHWTPSVTASFKGRWVKHRAYAKAGSGLGIADGILRLWADDVLVSHCTVVPWGNAQGNGFSRGYLWGAPNGGYDALTTPFVDDFSIWLTQMPSWITP